MKPSLEVTLMNQGRIVPRWQPHIYLSKPFGGATVTHQLLEPLHNWSLILHVSGFWGAILIVARSSKGKVVEGYTKATHGSIELELNQFYLQLICTWLVPRKLSWRSSLTCLQ